MEIINPFRLENTEKDFHILTWQMQMENLHKIASQGVFIIIKTHSDSVVMDGTFFKLSH